MNDVYWFYAREAGFTFWEKEPWNRRNLRIDWSSDYDDALEKYTQLVIEHTLREANKNEQTL